MAQMSEYFSRFLDTFTRALAESLSESRSDKFTIAWKHRGKGEAQRPDLRWFSVRVGPGSDSRVLVGWASETWRELGHESEDGCLAVFAAAIERAAQARLGSGVSCSGAGPADAPPEGWRGLSLAVRDGERSCPPIDLVISPELEESIDGPTPAIARNLEPMSNNAADLLMHVEMPVSVSFGRTQMRMQDLLQLTTGSIVELNQALADEVEVRVNNCVIARGEVVAVDGNYGVRIREIVSAPNTTQRGD